MAYNDHIGEKQNKQPKLSSTADAMANYEKQKERLASQVHDKIGQPLTALKFIVGRLSKVYKDEPLIGQTTVLIREVQVEVRKLSEDLQPAEYKSEGSSEKPKRTNDNRRPD